MSTSYLILGAVLVFATGFCAGGAFLGFKILKWMKEES
jgi:hypothetical protein